MIASLRKHHRKMIILIFIGLIILFIQALRYRDLFQTVIPSGITTP